LKLYKKKRTKPVKSIAVPATKKRRRLWSQQLDPHWGKCFIRLQNILKTVFRIRRIHIFLGLPDPDPLGTGTDPDPDPFIIKQN
jgi:hypothetical protein